MLVSKEYNHLPYSEADRIAYWDLEPKPEYFCKYCTSYRKSSLTIEELEYGWCEEDEDFVTGNEPGIAEECRYFNYKEG